MGISQSVLESYFGKRPRELDIERNVAGGHRQIELCPSALFRNSLAKIEHRDIRLSE